MNALDYLLTIVEPTINELERDPSNLRKDLVACIVTNYAADYIAKDRNEKERWKIVADINLTAPHFAWIADIANLTKHVVLSKEINKGRTNLIDFEAIHIGSSAAFDDGTFWDDGTSWTDASETVRADYPTDVGVQPIDITAAVKSVAGALKRYLQP